MVDARIAKTVPVDEMAEALDVSSSAVGKKVGSGVAPLLGASVSAAVGTSVASGDSASTSSPTTQSSANSGPHDVDPDKARISSDMHMASAAASASHCMHELIWQQ